MVCVPKVTPTLKKNLTIILKQSTTSECNNALSKPKFKAILITE